MPMAIGLKADKFVPFFMYMLLIYCKKLEGSGISMKKRIVSLVMVLALAVVGFAGFAQTVEASEYACASDECYVGVRPFKLDVKDGD